MPETHPEAAIQFGIIILEAINKSHIGIKLIRNITVIYNRFKRLCGKLSAGIEILI
jgi:hypothetical protein